MAGTADPPGRARPLLPAGRPRGHRRPARRRRLPHAGHHPGRGAGLLPVSRTRSTAARGGRVVAIGRDPDLDIDADGNFPFDSPATPDAAVLMTRDYQADPRTGRPAVWQIEAAGGPAPL